MAKSAATEIERRELYELLAAPESANLVQQALELAISGEPPSTITPAMISTASTRHPRMAFEFAVAHWDSIAPYIEPASRARYVPSLLHDASDPSLIDKLDAFAEHHIPPDARQDLRKAEATVRYLAEIRKDRLPEVDQWLKNQRA